MLIVHYLMCHPTRGFIKPTLKESKESQLPINKESHGGMLIVHYLMCHPTRGFIKPTLKESQLPINNMVEC